MKAQLDSSYNKISVEDFEYVAKLGVGGFGRVVHVKKKSTGKHYAMKTQLKTALVETYLDNPTRLDSEKTVFAACHHPFIVDMDYAFQTGEFRFISVSSRFVSFLVDPPRMKGVDDDER